MNKKIVIPFAIIFGWICSTCYLHAQSPFQVCSDTTFCIPGINGAPRSKGIIVERQNISDFSIQTDEIEGSAHQDNQTKVVNNERWKIKLRSPVINKENFKLGTELRYYVEEYKFENVNTTDNPLFQNFEDKALRSVGFSLFALKPFLGNKFIMARSSLSLNGDFESKDLEAKKTMKSSFSMLYGIKLTPKKSVAFGFNLSNNFGKAGVIPLISYNLAFGEKWLFESILPLNMKLNYITLNQANVVTLNIGLNGGNYNLLLTEKKLQEPKLFLRKSEMHFTMSYEREIHDWLWVGIESGWNKNLEFNVSKTIYKDDLVIKGNVNDGLYTAVRIFIVPPRKFLK